MRTDKILFMAILWGSSFLYGQNRQLLYDFTENPQALLLNPGMETSYKWYAGIPLLSVISIQAGTSGITVNDLFANDGLDFTTKVRDRAIFSMKPRDQIGSTYQVEFLNGGFRGKNRPEYFYSFGIYHEGDVIVYWPQDLPILAFEGNANSLGKRFDLSHLKTRGELINVFHFGVNKQMNNQLTLGARAKIYSGIFDFNSTGNKGYFVTTQGQNNLLANTLVADMNLRTSGIQGILDVLDDDSIDNNSGISQILKSRALLGGDLGLGLDLGFTYNLNEQTVITGSLLDVGFIYHSKDVQNYTLKGSATVEGIEVILPEALADPNADLWQELVDEIEGLIPFEDNNKGYVTFRPTKLNASIRYNFGAPKQTGVDCDCDINIAGGSNNRFKYPNSVGGQLFMINRPRGPQTAFTAFYQRRFGNVLGIKTTYTVDKFSFSNIGLGLNVQAGPVNIYVMADNLLAYRNLADSHYSSFQLGLNIISWGNK